MRTEVGEKRMLGDIFIYWKVTEKQSVKGTEQQLTRG